MTDQFTGYRLAQRECTALYANLAPLRMDLKADFACDLLCERREEFHKTIPLQFGGLENANAMPRPSAGQGARPWLCSSKSPK